MFVLYCSYFWCSLNVWFLNVWYWKKAWTWTWTTDIEELIHYLTSIWATCSPNTSVHAGEIWTKSHGPKWAYTNCEISVKMVIQFWKKKWKTFLWLKQVMLYYWSKDYHLPSNVPKLTVVSHVTRLKIALNMTDPISLNENLP